MARGRPRITPRVVGTTGGTGEGAGDTSGAGDIDGSNGFDAGAPIIIDPAEFGEPGPVGGSTGPGDGSAAGEPAKRRGRKPGSGRSSKAAASVSVNSLAATLAVVHAAAAAMLSAPELQLDETEAKSFAEASLNVMRHYPAMAMPAQVVDWIGLISVGAMIYGPRMIAIRNNRAAARAKPVNPLPQNVARETTARPAPQPATPNPPPANDQQSGDMADIVIPGLTAIRRSLKP